MANNNDDGAGCVSAILMFAFMVAWLYLVHSDGNLCREQNLQAVPGLFGALCVDKATGVVTAPRPVTAEERR